jgi:hypothetical protein
MLTLDAGNDPSDLQAERAKDSGEPIRASHGAPSQCNPTVIEAIDCTACRVAGGPLLTQDEMLEARRDLLSGFLRCDHGMYLEIHEVAPVREPLVQ